ncbi:hypothetical protein RB628_08825 [Streptomyces sp. ADMS]|uniref:hypothetical protein n=1 Tax=Streptomyces sp. ADMS TaxID=3071415 RepID=UPI00296F9858|nr:hypothetical protein [Streptomyces sp. ADMS]MDW4905447.1 hypothetical protein [Streptomyces sp. ADMS]
MSAPQLAALAARTAEPHVMLRRFLALDALVTGTNAVAYLLAAGPLARFLGVGSGLLLGLGLVLAVYAGAVGGLASRRQPSALPVRVVIEVNLAWAVLSCVALILWLTPSTAGTVWALLQAAVVAGFAVLQHVSLKARQLIVE